MKLSKAYDPNKYEKDIYAFWEAKDVFKPEHRGNDQTFSLVMPPPNANANIHIGTAITLDLEDIAVRYNRLRGKATLFVPGADHAGFETQSVFEKHLTKEGKSRFDFSREELYKLIWDFVGENKSNYETQFRRLGVSCDWSRYTFTLDKKIIDRAYQTFKKMWDEGLIYRSERLVNYCTYHRTGFADIEVVYEDVTTPLYYMKYGPFELATTRPETKFGDTAVAVHPKDKRYGKWVGKTVEVEGVNGPFEVRVVADEMVDPDFGTGVVKITPAHSFDDWEVAQRHNLQAVRVINHDGTLNHKAGKFAGMTVAEGRKAVAEALEEKGLLVKVDNHYKTRVGHCYKCGTVIEPMLLDQWFINMEPLAKQAIAALKDNQIKFYPSTKKDQLITYLEGLRDWNISRQIAWGIPIPAFQNVNDSDDWIFNDQVDKEEIKVDGKTYRRDPDVFDTWFSSSSWPYATLNYPDGQDFKEFYPLKLLETGGEILYPWVSRMIMLGLYITGKVPFEAVYIHGYVMAQDGSKMSKSLGNVIDPIPVIEEFGSDALRMGLISGRAPAVNRGYDPRRIEEARNFCNKLWNIARFVQEVMDGEPAMSEPWPATPADNWILTKLQHLTDKMASDLDSYRFAEAYERLYHFVWDDFADWYIEASKAAPNHNVLEYTLACVLKVAHPFAPFVTEAIWQQLDWYEGILAVESWPEVPAADKAAAKQFEDIKTIVTESRQLTRAMKLKKPLLRHQEVGFMETNGELITRLARLGGVKLLEQGSEGLKLSSTRLNVWIDVTDEQIKSYAKELVTKQTEVKAQIKALKQRLDNKKYVHNAPAKVVQETKDQLAEVQATHDMLAADLARLK